MPSQGDKDTHDTMTPSFPNLRGSVGHRPPFPLYLSFLIFLKYINLVSWCHYQG